MQRKFRRSLGGFLVCVCIYMFLSTTSHLKIESGPTRMFTQKNNTTLATSSSTQELPPVTSHHFETTATLLELSNKIKCRKNLENNLKLNRTIIPKRYWENIPPREYKECGANSLISPNIKENDKYWMTFLIKSAPAHFKLRETIRRTWGQVSELSGRKILTIFLLGKPIDDNQQGLLNMESEIHGDILQCDVEDTYDHLTIKVLSTFRWLLERNFRSYYYTFGDDDTTMNIANIFVYFNELTRRNISDTMVCGYTLLQGGIPVRQIANKWYMSYELYDMASYPTYCYGAMWTITPNLLNDIYCMSRITDSENFHIDDVYITGILRHKISQNETMIHTPALTKDISVELMSYLWTESRINKVQDIEKTWNKWKTLLTSSEPLMKDVEGQIQSETVKYRTLNESENLKPIGDSWRAIEPTIDLWKLHSNVNVFGGIRFVKYLLFN